MNKHTLLKAAAAACVVALIASGILILSKSLHIGISYADSQRYTAGAATLDDAVKNLDIDWTDGSVTIAYHAQNTVEISETSPKAIPADGELRWWLDGETLRIQYAKSGFASLKSLEKALTVTLPEGTALGSVSIDAASADVCAPELDADSVTIDLSSGDIELGQTGAAELVKLSSTSGDIRAALADAKSVQIEATSGAIGIDQSGAADSVRLSSTSGDVRAALSTVNALSASTTSGGIAIEGNEAQKVSLDSTSGAIDVRLAAFEDISIEATSGDVTAALPSEPGYRADIETTSGGFDYSVALRREDGRYACGDGSASVRIHTTSGNVLLTPVEGEK